MKSWSVGGGLSRRGIRLPTTQINAPPGGAHPGNQKRRQSAGLERAAPPSNVNGAATIGEWGGRTARCRNERERPGRRRRLIVGRNGVPPALPRRRRAADDPLRAPDRPNPALTPPIFGLSLVERLGMIFTDKTLSCRDCGAGFVFSAGEQQRCAALGFGDDPGRCPACRTQWKAVESRPVILPRSRRGLGRAGPGGPFVAVCSACGRETQLPFKPKGDRPVYCGACFERRRG